MTNPPGAMPPLPEGYYHESGPTDYMGKLLEYTAEDMQAYAAPLIARVAELEAALHEVGDLAASSQSGPAKTEALQTIEVITAKAAEHRDGRLSALERAAKAESEVMRLTAESAVLWSHLAACTTEEGPNQDELNAAREALAALTPTKD